MRTYISDIIPRIQKFSQKLDNLTLLTNQHWVVIDDIDKTKNVYIFRQNNELLISQNGKVEKAKWEYLGHNSLLIDRKDESFLFKHGFFDENILALKIDSKEEYAFLVNETKFDKELNSLLNIIEFLEKKYVDSYVKKNVIGIGVEDKTYSINELIYLAPNYQILRKAERFSFLEGKLYEYRIKFEDGLNGKVFLKEDKQAFFKATPIDYWLSMKFVYSDIDNCINALHYFLKNGIELETGFIIKY